MADPAVLEFSILRQNNPLEAELIKPCQSWYRNGGGSSGGGQEPLYPVVTQEGTNDWLSTS